MYANVHIGNAIKKVMKRKGLSLKRLGGMIGRSHVSVWSMLKKKHISMPLLLAISEALQHDFLQYYYPPELLPANPEQVKEIEKLKSRIEELENENKEQADEIAFLNRLLKELKEMGEKQ